MSAQLSFSNSPLSPPPTPCNLINIVNFINLICNDLLLFESGNKSSTQYSIPRMTIAGTMSAVLTIAIAPFVLFLTVPLVISAAITSFFAFITLAIRLALVYMEFGLSILRQQFSVSVRPRKAKVEYTNWAKSNPYEWDIHNTPSGLPPSTRTLPRRTPAFQQVGSAVMTPLARDYEGLGGWRFLGSDDEDDEALWTSMNSRLELPAMLAIAEGRRRKHHRNRSAISLSTLQYERRQRRASPIKTRPASAMVSGTVSPEELFTHDLRAFTRSRPVSDVVSGSVSPEEGFGERRGSRGTMILDGAGMNVGNSRSMIRRKRKSSSSSGSSTLTLLAGSMGN